MTSSNRSGDTPSTDGARPQDERVVVQPGGDGGLPVRDDEPTVISNRPPLGGLPGNRAAGIELGSLKPGDVVGHYRILDYVGGGGMGRVFRAEDTQLNRQVAMKVLPLEQAAEPETVLRFRNEARSAARLDHENIARVYHVGEDRGFPYLVFEFVEGTTVRALVEQRGPLTLGEAVSYTLQVADALAHAAAQDVVHRDIKPSNLIITGGGRVKVIDLGLARIQQAEDAATDLTASGVTLGTFDYISPEQARDPRLVDTRSDIYSLGCAFFYMLSGRPPFPEGTVLQKLLQHQGDKPPDIHESRPELPDEVSRILQKMLAKDPNHRYQTATELIEQLQGLAERMGLRVVGTGRRVWAMPHKPRVPWFQRHLPWMASVTALVCVVLVLDALWPKETEAPPLGTDSQVAIAPEDFVSAPPAASAERSGAASVANGGRSTDQQAKAPGGTAAGVADSLPGSEQAGPAAENVARNAPAAAVEQPLMNEPRPALAGSPLVEPPEMIPGTDTSVDPGMLPEGVNPADLRWPAMEATALRRTGVLTVGSGRLDGRDYPTLSAACGAAQAGDIIELCYNGRREERPIDLPSAKLIICAGTGFQPVVVFRPEQDDPVEYHRSMFTLAGGELSMQGVAVELDLPRELSGSRWVLWELGEGARLRLQQSSLTVANPFGHDVSVFRTKATPGLDLAVTGPALEGPAPIEISLTDCVVRGQAVTLLAKSLQPVRLSWTNGVLATSEWFLCALGGDRDPAPDEAIELQLKHVTARVDKGLCLLDNSRFTPCQLPVRVDCSDSIILVSSPQAALVEQFGEHPVNLEQSWLTWTGDRNGYQGLTIFWRIEDLNPDETTKLLAFDEWQEHWPNQEIHSRVGRIEFVSLPAPSRPAHSTSPADFRLGDAPGNWARGGASDLTDVGAAIDRLPPLPAPPEASPSPRTGATSGGPAAAGPLPKTEPRP